jgi:hypothetical protein
MRRRWAVLLLGTAWLCTLGVGEWCLVDYEVSPGKAAVPMPAWPTGSRLSRTPGVFNLLVFAHPRCPCTRATIAELAIVMARCSERIRARVVFFKPAQAIDEWAETDLRRTAATIPGVTICCDEAGIEAMRFGARTSGQVFLYDRQGRLRFQGGITSARGHAGENRGRQAICSIVLEGAKGDADSCVFGCSLQDPCPTTEGGVRCPR